MSQDDEDAEENKRRGETMKIVIHNKENGYICQWEGEKLKVEKEEEI